MSARSARFGEHEHTDRELRAERSPRTYNEAAEIETQQVLATARRVASAIADALHEADTRIQRRSQSRG